MKPEEALDRIAKALDIAIDYGGIDGVQHKAWTIDQMVRALTGCPQIEVKGKDWNNQPYVIYKLGESDEYKQLVQDARAGELGPETYEWDEGIAP